MPNPSAYPQSDGLFRQNHPTTTTTLPPNHHHPHPPSPLGGPATVPLSDQPLNPSSLPPGWTTVVSSTDGRVFFYHESSGRSSWSHPAWNGNNNAFHGNVSKAVPPPPPRTTNYYQVGGDSGLMDYHHHGDTPINAHRRPDSRECQSMVALVLFFPIGLFAVYHSVQTNTSWSSGRYSDAVYHARQVPNYANLGITVGVIFWIYMIFFREGKNPFRDWEMPWGDR